MLHFQLQPQDGYLLAEISGLVSPQAWAKVLGELEAALQGAASERLVVDLGGLVGWLGEPERRAVGTLMATHLAQMKKVALVIEARKITDVVSGEARRRGLALRLFPLHEDAVLWVLS